MLKKFIALAFLMSAIAMAWPAQAHECRREVIRSVANSLALLTDDFQDAVRNVEDYQDLANYAEQVHLAAHEVIDRVDCDTCYNMRLRFARSRHDYYHLQEGFRRAYLRSPNFQISQVLQRVVSTYRRLQDALEGF